MGNVKPPTWHWLVGGWLTSWLVNLIWPTGYNFAV